MNLRKIKGKMAENSITQLELAKELKINPSTLSRKMRKGTFSMKEFFIIIKFLNISPNEVNEIFFDNKCA